MHVARGQHTACQLHACGTAHKECHACCDRLLQVENAEQAKLHTRVNTAWSAVTWLELIASRGVHHERPMIEGTQVNHTAQADTTRHSLCNTSGGMQRQHHQSKLVRNSTPRAGSLNTVTSPCLYLCQPAKMSQDRKDGFASLV